MTQHTPGPWHLERRHNCQAIVDSNNQDLAYQDTHPRFLNGDACGSVTSRGRTQEELQANARLIAAAPDLLRACKDALWRLGELEGSDAQHIDGSTQHRIALAIAAAQGQEAPCSRP